MTAEELGKGLLAVREAHRYCISSPIYSEYHRFEQCPVLKEFNRLLALVNKECKCV